MGAIITLSILALVVLYLGLFKAKALLLPVSILGFLVAIGFLLNDWTADKGPLFSGMVHFDHYAIAFSVLCIVVTLCIFIISKGYFDEGDRLQSIIHY
ncbi:hypothetical protein [Sphingobacterium sp. E70]|uniref:hypothetical protein n=1 Tax=Sphingobacterium sp. E70 TaxID=2853439 RepID=UPI002795E4F1|nr:hypothetical protein [Sphingobacterium sp. E70]